MQRFEDRIRRRSMTNNLRIVMFLIQERVTLAPDLP